MDTLLLLKALILGVVEGLTEFLPISSTGHLILAGDLLGFNDARGKLFEVVIQSGAILAVVWEYRERILGVCRGLGRERLANRLVLNLFIAFLPLAVLGLLFKKSIEAHLFQPLPVAAAFIVGQSLCDPMMIPTDTAMRAPSWFIARLAGTARRGKRQAIMPVTQ